MIENPIQTSNQMPFPDSIMFVGQLRKDLKTSQATLLDNFSDIFLTLHFAMIRGVSGRSIPFDLDSE
jgi:hypothetical protein